MRLMLTIIKVFIILFMLCQWELRQGTPWQFPKQISKLSFQLSSQIYSVLAQTERERKAFFGRVQEKGDHIVRLSSSSQEHLVVIRYEKASPFVKFGITLPILCLLLDPLTNKHCRIWSSMINLWIDSKTC